MSLFNLAIIAFQLLIIAGVVALIPLIFLDVKEWGKE
jgi:hypothetical protein